MDKPQSRYQQIGRAGIMRLGAALVALLILGYRMTWQVLVASTVASLFVGLLGWLVRSIMEEWRSDARRHSDVDELVKKSAHGKTARPLAIGSDGPRFGEASPHILGVAGEDLKPGDFVSIGAHGTLTKARPGLAQPIVGPAAPTIEDHIKGIRGIADELHTLNERMGSELDKERELRKIYRG